MRSKIILMSIVVPLALTGCGSAESGGAGASGGSSREADSPRSLEGRWKLLAAEDVRADADAAVAAPHPLSRTVLPLSIKTIVIDPGHGGKQTGAISDSGMSEKEITLDVALRLRRLMEKSPFEVFLTRQTDQTIPLEKRVAFANSKNAVLFVSIHVNWMEPRDIRGLETYFVGPSDDPATLNLASMENRESNYSFADYRRILEKLMTWRDEGRRADGSPKAGGHRLERRTDLRDRGERRDGPASASRRPDVDPDDGRRLPGLPRSVRPPRRFSPSIPEASAFPA